MNDDDLVFAAYRLILNLVIPSLRAKKLDDIRISWPCSTENSAADWTVAAFYYKNRLAFVIWCHDQTIMVGLPAVGKFRGIKVAGLQEISKESIADPKCHVKVLACVVELILDYRAKRLPRK